MTDIRPRRTPILDGRLSVAMALSEGWRTFADIGADHGRLSAVMLLGGAQRALVADVSAAALQKARKRLHGLGLEDRAVFSVADGLDALCDWPYSTPDGIFILGMGGDTVSGILTRGHMRLNGAELVLGAQTELPVVRRTLCDIGYRIRREVVASEAGRDYVLMHCSPAATDEPVYCEEELLLGPGLMREPAPQWLPVLERRRRLLAQGIEAMQRSRAVKDEQRLQLFLREAGYVQRYIDLIHQSIRKEDAP